MLRCARCYADGESVMTKKQKLVLAGAALIFLGLGQLYPETTMDVLEWIAIVSFLADLFTGRYNRKD